MQLITNQLHHRSLSFIAYNSHTTRTHLIVSERNRQSVNLIVREAENHVITFKKNRMQELWHDDCIFPIWKMSETAFLALLQTEGCRKRCFSVQATRSKGENIVFD